MDDDLDLVAFLLVVGIAVTVGIICITKVELSNNKVIASSNNPALTACAMGDDSVRNSPFCYNLSKGDTK